MLWETLIAARDLGRLQEIVSILIRYGFVDAVERMGLTSALESAGKLFGKKQSFERSSLTKPERVRYALEALGPTFVKLGQILSVRVDLFGPEWITEFEKLQDQVPPVAFDALRTQLEEDLGASPEEVFLHFETQPLAAASIAQVHCARLKSGEEVVLKIRRPNIDQIIEADLRLLARLAQIAENEIDELRHFQPTEIVKQFALSLRRELDLATEAGHTERVAKHFKDDPTIVIAKVHWQWCCQRLNVQSYIKGISGRDLQTVDQSGLDRALLAQRGAHAVLKMVLEDGYYHADPHAGNILYLPDNRIAFLDFGMIGRLSQTRRDQIVDLLNAMVKKDVAEVTDLLLLWAGETHVNASQLAIEVESFFDDYYGIPLQQLNVATMLTDLTMILRNHQLMLPPDLSLLFKVFISLEGLGRQLDPAFDMVSAATPFLKQAMIERYAPEAIAKRGMRSLTSLIDIVGHLPQDIKRLMRTARRGAFQIKIDIARLEKFGNQLDKSASRITVGMITAALIIGSSIVMTVSGGPTLFGLPMFGLLGYLAAGIGGIWVLISIARGGR